MDSAEGVAGDSSGSGPKNVDRLTRSLKMNLLRLEGEVDKVRTELGTLKGQVATPTPGEAQETAWIPMLNAEIVVGDADSGGLPAETNGTTNKKSIQEILNKIPAQALVQAGFNSQSEEESLARLERELVDFGKQLNDAVRWVRKMRGAGESAETPVFDDESGPDSPPYSDTVKMKWEEIAKKVPIEKKPAPRAAPKTEKKPEVKPDEDPSFDIPTSKLTPPPIKTGEVKSTQSTVRAAPLPFVAKPRGRFKPVLAIALLLTASLAGGAAAYYAFSDNPAGAESMGPQKVQQAMVPLTPPSNFDPGTDRAEDGDGWETPPADPAPKSEEFETIVVESPSEAEDPRLQRARDLGLGYLAKKEYRKAEGFLAPWVQEAADDPEIHYLYGRALFYLGKLKQAAHHLTRATELDPGYADAYFELGGVYMRLKWFKKAEEALTRFIQLRPEEPRAGTVRNLLERNLK
ncbi:tetratricopeptide repeat protein [Myxococcota bacterium]